MNRYKIAIQHQNKLEERKAYRFPATKYVARTIQFINYCMDEKVIYIADNVPQNVLDAAVISVSKTTEVPIVVSTDSQARLFSISHSHKIYSLESPPRGRYVICYNCSDHKLNDIKSVVVVYGHTGEIKFL